MLEEKSHEISKSNKKMLNRIVDIMHNKGQGSRKLYDETREAPIQHSNSKKRKNELNRIMSDNFKILDKIK